MAFRSSSKPPIPPKWVLMSFEAELADAYTFIRTFDTANSGKIVSNFLPRLLFKVNECLGPVFVVYNVFWIYVLNGFFAKTSFSCLTTT